MVFAGHPDCAIRPDPTFRRHANTTHYNWQRFAAQNEISKSIVEEFGFIYVDVATPMIPRHDGHIGFKFVEFTKSLNPSVDCLHYCLPGPIDLWVEFLYNVLLRLVPV